MNLLLLLVTALLLTAYETKVNNDSVLSGEWITESCEQITASVGNTSNKWQEAIYSFTDSSNIFFGSKSYSDSNCINIIESISPKKIDGLVVTYSDIKETLLEEGIMGFTLNIKLKTDTNTLSRSAFFRINSTNVCFSEAFNFNVFNFGVSEAGLDAINFNQCLKNL